MFHLINHQTYQNKLNEKKQDFKKSVFNKQPRLFGLDLELNKSILCTQYTRARLNLVKQFFWSYVFLFIWSSGFLFIRSSAFGLMDQLEKIVIKKLLNIATRTLYLENIKKCILKIANCRPVLTILSQKTKKINLAHKVTLLSKFKLPYCQIGYVHEHLPYQKVGIDNGLLAHQIFNLL